MKTCWGFLSAVSANFKVFVNVLFEGFAACRIVPVILDEAFEMIVSVNCCADICIVVFKFTRWDIARVLELIKLSCEFLKDFSSIHLSCLEFRMSLNVVVSFQLFKWNWLLSVWDRIKSKFDLSLSILIQITSQHMQELLMIDLSSVVSIEVLVKSFKFSWRELMTIHLHSPLEFFSFKLLVANKIHSS